MEKIYLTVKSVLSCLFVSSLVFTSCSSDAPTSEYIVEPFVVVGSPDRVFVNAVPKTTSDVKSITLDSKGRVSTMNTDDGKVTFTYAQTRSVAMTYDVLMSIDVEDGSESYKDEFYLKIGDNGFVTSAVEKDEDAGSIQKWSFKYTDDGHLNFVEKSDEDRYSLTYNNDGDIAYVAFTDLSESNPTIDRDTIDYTSQAVPTAIENKGNLMEWDNTFNIDMDNMKYAYYAGLLGLSTKHLPVAVRSSDGFNLLMNWTLNKDNYPTMLKVDYPYGSPSETYNFTW